MDKVLTFKQLPEFADYALRHKLGPVRVIRRPDHGKPIYVQLRASGYGYTAVWGKGLPAHPGTALDTIDGFTAYLRKRGLAVDADA